ncbi:MAG: tRNA uridine-5-carboxymethylaminomethyl(34) synthesis enzyme MnmG [Omnitrophica bacterium GWA2_52_12]|nr:MAG: tRNA uridine-5-carboxymethylaminomethyl(34) synthesis enzyme MnmG [Omnitrophica bacterium GWA2_52_12]
MPELSQKKYGAIVVGAGHAGVEAALAVARCGYPVLLLSMDLEAIARMSCNPAIGGLAKGHIVREIDALGGEMGLAIDATGIQFRMLNRSRGPAVWAPRAQADKKQYSLYMARALRQEPNIELKQAQASELLVEQGCCVGIVTQAGEKIYGDTVILTTGTFLQGLIHVGNVNYAGGRRDEPPAVGLSDSLRKHGIELIRFKTGTPPRLRAASIDWEKLEEQKGDEPPQPFSYRTKAIETPQISCHITYTNERTHQIIRDHLHLSPLYAGRIVGTGPRYCPSIEDKVVKFCDKTRHQIFLEPEGLDTDEIYVNGMSMSLPAEVQKQIVQSIHGLERAEIVRNAYAIEYDCAPPTQLKHSLETKRIQNLFLAGQINCTSGYEEAAAQGLMAGLNAVRKIRGEPAFVLDRSEAYIGVLIDDLVTRGTTEPYRMFTSRAEFRIVLRQDNADERLMKYGRAFGLIAQDVFKRLELSVRRIKIAIESLQAKFHQSVRLDQMLKRPGVEIDDLVNLGIWTHDLNPSEARKASCEVKYEGYVSRQLEDVRRFKISEKKQIPEAIDYKAIKGISHEAKEKLARIKPASIGQASRIPGVSSCDLSLLVVHLEKQARSKN